MVIKQSLIGWASLGLIQSTTLYHVFPFLKCIIRRKMDYDDIPLYYIITTYINYYCLHIYGIMIIDFMVRIGYLIADVIYACLLFLYLIVEIKQNIIDGIINFIIFILGTWFLDRLLTITIDNEDKVGKICLITTIIVHMKSLSLISKVIKDKNYNFIPIFYCYTIVISSSTWIIFGYNFNLYYLMISNIIAFAVCLVQIIIYHIFKRKYSSIIEKETSGSVNIELGNSKESEKIEIIEEEEKK